MKKCLGFLFVAGLYASASGQDASAVKKDDAFPFLVYQVEMGYKSELWAAFMTLATGYASEMSPDMLVEGLMKGDGLLSYDDKKKVISMVADGAQETSFKMSMAVHPKFGAVIKVVGANEMEERKFSDLLLRVQGGWINLEKDWKKQVSTSVYEGLQGGKKYVYTLHWVKNNAAVFGYGYEVGKPGVTFPVRGLNDVQGVLELRLSNGSFSLKKTSVGGKVAWANKPLYEGDKVLTLVKK